MTVAAAKPMRRRLAYLVAAGRTRDLFEIGIGPRVAIAIGIIYVAGAALAPVRVDTRRRELEEQP